MAIFVCPTEQGSCATVFSMFWRDASGEIGDHAGPVIDVDCPVPGCEELSPEEAYWYIWEHGVTPVERLSWARIKALYIP